MGKLSFHSILKFVLFLVHFPPFSQNIASIPMKKKHRKGSIKWAIKFWDSCFFCASPSKENKITPENSIPPFSSIAEHSHQYTPTHTHTPSSCCLLYEFVLLLRDLTKVGSYGREVYVFMFLGSISIISIKKQEKFKKTQHSKWIKFPCCQHNKKHSKHTHKNAIIICYAS